MTAGTSSARPAKSAILSPTLRPRVTPKLAIPSRLPSQPAIDPLPGYKDVQPFVYAGFFPESNEFYQDLKDAIEKLSLSDSALQFAPENSPVLGLAYALASWDCCIWTLCASDWSANTIST